MELVVRKTDLLRELQLFQGIVERKNTIPILANVLLEANGDEVKLLATDLEVGLRSKCAASVTKSGVADAAGEEAVRNRQGAARNRRPDRGRQERRQGRGGSVRLADADAAARRFSDAARVERHVQRDAAARRRASRWSSKTQFAITGEDTRYFLNGALFILQPDSMSLVSTDGHRLALISVPREKREAKEGEADEERVILPRKTLLELGRLLGEGEGDIQLRARREPPVLRRRRPAC